MVIAYRIENYRKINSNYNVGGYIYEEKNGFNS